MGVVRLCINAVTVRSMARRLANSRGFSDTPSQGESHGVSPDPVSTRVFPLQLIWVSHAKLFSAALAVDWIDGLCLGFGISFGLLYLCLPEFTVFVPLVMADQLSRWAGAADHKSWAEHRYRNVWGFGGKNPLSDHHALHYCMLLYVRCYCSVRNIRFNWPIYRATFRREIPKSKVTAYNWIPESTSADAIIIDPSIHAAYLTERISLHMPLPTSK